MLTPGLEPISDPGSSISFTEIDTVWKNYGEGEMSEYHSLSEADLQQFLKLLPSGQGEKLKLSLEPVLDNLVWTSLDAVNALSDALEEKGIELNPERFEELLSRFLESSFESDYITQQVNEHLTDLARDFLSSSVADQK